MFTPEGLEKVARGWSEAETPGNIRKIDRILKGCGRPIVNLILSSQDIMGVVTQAKTQPMRPERVESGSK
jgi:hypothetical protein